jgi:hypothetical protein
VTADPGQAEPSPAPGPVTAAVFAALSARAGALLALEDQAAALSAAPLRTRIAEILRRLTALYARLAGSLDLPLPEAAAGTVREELTAAFESLRGHDPSEVVADIARKAYHDAVAFSEQQIGTVAADRLPGIEGDDALSRALGALPAVIGRRIDDAQLLANEAALLDYRTAVLQPVAKVSQAASAVEHTARWSVNRADGAGVSDTARQKDAFLLWAGERTACVHCAAHIGHYVRAGGSFPTGLTFGDKPLIPWPDPDRLDGPPLHPNCRCELIPWLGPVAAHPYPNAIYNQPALAGQVDLAAAMRREAKRAILRGWSLPSESEAVRVRAADRLLKAGAGMPKTVEARARKAVRAKHFPDRHGSRQGF